jgi:hypothetical protein
VDLLREAEALLRAAEGAGLQAALLGGLAVRAHLGVLPRETFDIDIAMSSVPEVDAFGRLLVARGYDMLEEPWWRRAVRGGTEGRIIVDWTGPEIVDPTTLRRFRLGPERVRRRLVSTEVAVVAVPDLLALKLLAGRDQDIADLACLAGPDPEGDAQAVMARGQDASASDPLRAEARQLQFSLHLGEAQEAAARVLGRALTADEVDRLSRFVDALSREEPR